MKTSERRPGISTGVTLALVAVIAIVIIGLVYYASTTNATGVVSGSTTSTTTTTAAPTTATSTASSTTTSPSAQPKTVYVSLPDGVGTNQASNFQPPTITLVIGVNNTVVWTNNDGAPHTVTATSVPSGATKFDSGNLSPGATFTYTFTAPGTYKYDCTYHFWMQGTIIVNQS
jgi:plastocyanin